MKALKEDINVKRNILLEISSKIDYSHHIFASNTSSLYISEIFIDIFPLEFVIEFIF